MIKGIAIVYKDGSKDWFDPVIEEFIEERLIKITLANGNIYDVIISEVESKTYY